MNTSLAQQYVIARDRGQGCGGGRAQYTHIVTAVLDYLPDAYRTVCTYTKRGPLTDGPTPERPLCRRCHDMTTQGVVWRSRDREGR